MRNNAWTAQKHGAVTQEKQLQQRLAGTHTQPRHDEISWDDLERLLAVAAAKLVVAAAPALDVAALREVLLTMDTETRDVRVSSRAIPTAPRYSGLRTRAIVTQSDTRGCL